jgi:hypothetical protein
MRCCSSYWSIHCKWLQKPQSKTVTYMPHTLQSHFQLLTFVRSICQKKKSIRKILCDSTTCTYRNSDLVPIAGITCCWFNRVLMYTFHQLTSRTRQIRNGTALLTESQNGLEHRWLLHHCILPSLCSASVIYSAIGKTKLIIIIKIPSNATLVGYPFGWCGVY